MDTVKCTRLRALADRCLREPPSRRLDAEIHCAVLDDVNGNVLGTERLLKAASDGGVLLVRRETGGTDWYVSPPYTSEMLSADLLLPENVRTIAKEPRQVCSIALLAMVTAYCSESLARGLIMIG